VDSTDDTSILVKQLGDSTPLIVTTIQKLNNSIQNKRCQERMERLKTERIVFKTRHSTKDGQAFYNYAQDIAKRMKERDKKTFQQKDRVDILLLVNMFLKGNILCFRNLKQRTDDAIALFSNLDA